MLPDRVSNPGPLTYESGAIPIALRGPTYTICNGLRDGRIDGRTDGAILICHRSFFGGIKRGTRRQ